MIESLHQRIDRERKDANPHVENVAVYRRYAEGDQDGTLDSVQKTILGSSAKHPYADNVADMVLATWSSRLALDRYEVENETTRTFLGGFYARNHLSDLCYDVNYATGRDGNHAVMLRWLSDDRPIPISGNVETSDLPLGTRGGRVTVHAEDWWDGKTGVWVAYDDFSRPAYAVKDFDAYIDQPQGPPAKRKRRTVYFPDHLERYIAEGAGWAPYPLPGEPDDAIVPWTKRDGSPLGLPVVHFAYPRFGRRRYGVSELAGGFLAGQDQVNSMQQSLTAAALILAFQILTATGVTFEKPPVLQPGTILQSAKDTARFDAIQAGDLTQLTQALETKLQTLARGTMTPLHIIKGGDWPAGIALVQAEKPLIGKVARLAETIGPSWVEVAHRATEMANAFGREALDEDAILTAVFADPEQLDQLAQTEVKKTKAEADKTMAEAQQLIEMLADVESLVAMGIPEAEAKTRIAAREARAKAEAEMLTGIAAQQGQNQEGEAA